MLNLPSFFAYVCIATFSPGPNNIMAMGSAGRQGFQKSVPFCAGVMVGFILLMIACLAATSALYTLLPSAQTYMKVIGAAYILYLAYKVYKSGGMHAQESAPLGFGPGVLLQFVNPKGIIYGLTVASVYLLPVVRAPLPLLLLSVALGAVCLLSTLLWAAFGAIFQKLFENHGKLINAVMAALLVLCAVSLFLE